MADRAWDASPLSGRQLSPTPSFIQLAAADWQTTPCWDILVHRYLFLFVIPRCSGRMATVGATGSLGSASSGARCVSGARLMETTRRWAGYRKRQRSEARALDGHIIQRPGRGSYFEKRERHAQYVFRIFSNVLLFSQLLSFRIYEEAVYG